MLETCVRSEMIGFRGLFLFAAVLLFGTGQVHSSDMNWGKKTRCFMVDDSVVCPGCNFRAGQSCPRSLRNSQNCLTPTPTWPTYRKYTPKVTTETTYEDDTNSTEEMLTTIDLRTPETEIQKEPTSTPIDMTLFLYRIIGRRAPYYNYYARYRYKRELQQEEENLEPEVCNWTGDCPCPLLCCNTGPGCPKKCVMGIRLQPQNG